MTINQGCMYVVWEEDCLSSECGDSTTHEFIIAIGDHKLKIHLCRDHMELWRKR